MLGAQRRIEARIGQLLPLEKCGRGKTRTHEDEFRRDGDRNDFRILARALSGECPLDEARIGQLLPSEKGGRGQTRHHADGF